MSSITKRILKLVPVCALFVCTLNISASAFAIAGGQDSGGGNIQKSTRADLENLVAQWWRTAIEVSDDHLRGESFRITQRALSEDIRPVMQSITGENYFTINRQLAKYLQTLQFKIVDETCIDGTKEKDASTAHELNSPICLSAPRLARFPRAVLRQIFVPLVLHEVTHQFGWGENEANQIQSIAELHLKYRPLYLSASRAAGTCAYSSQTSLTADELRSAQLTPAIVKARSEEQRRLVILQCVQHATQAGDGLSALNDGDLWDAIAPAPFTTRELEILRDNGGRKEQTSFLTMADALSKPGSQTSCPTCEKFHVDQPYIMMLGARQALQYIDVEIGRLQSEIH